MNKNNFSNNEEINIDFRAFKFLIKNSNVDCLKKDVKIKIL